MMRFILIALALLALPARADVEIQSVTSKGGHKAWLVEEHSLPFVALEISFRGGTSLDRPGKRGSVELMVSLLEEGAGELDARGFAEANEALATSFGFRASRDSLNISAQFLTENRDASVALLRSALASPRFDDDAVVRVRGQLLSSLRSRQTNPGDILSEAWDSAIFGDHPYGTYDGGTEASVQSLTRDDLITAYKDTMALDLMYVGAVGDITADELAVLLDNLLSDLPEKGGSLPDRAEQNFDGGQTLIHFETPQSIARFGHGGLRRDDQDFFPAYLVSQVMGGLGSDGRLMQEVREKRGLTYGIGAYLFELDYAEGFYGQFSSQNDNMAEALDVVRREWARMAEEGITPEELNAAKTYLTGSYPLRFDGNSNIANILVGMQMEGLPIDYIATRNDKVNAVTLDDANRVAARIFQPDELTFMVIGKPDGLSDADIAN
ncbi:pitrilysin family protein [Aliiroseovarius sp. KMU-50]|uniref:Pitrilysin family protein n=1 Tax=Aliiroseovarius salicola TaxID=3009082 RepID=A0ABT4VWT7_9RHOB|nr:pitrilysin family protein [Aliiroseovarius sp. KMU-50]MDA5092720.1 pitrilysin family protein [Aliiroseovarius sp. KMU-50]